MGHGGQSSQPIFLHDTPKCRLMDAEEQCAGPSHAGTRGHADLRGPGCCLSCLSPTATLRVVGRHSCALRPGHLLLGPVRTHVALGRTRAGACRPLPDTAAAAVALLRPASWGPRQRHSRAGGWVALGLRHAARCVRSPSASDPEPPTLLLMSRGHGVPRTRPPGCPPSSDTRATAASPSHCPVLRTGLSGLALPARGDAGAPCVAGVPGACAQPSRPSSPWPSLPDAARPASRPTCHCPSHKVLVLVSWQPDDGGPTLLETL